MIGPYKTATAFRVALEERLRQRALESGTPLDRLRKEVAFQRLFARMTAGDAAEGWVLTGAQVLLIRLDERARATKDADTTWRYEASELQAALDDAMELDLGDGFSFEIGSRSRLEAAYVTNLLRVAAVEPSEGPLRHARHGQGAPNTDERRPVRRRLDHVHAPAFFPSDGAP